MKVDIKYPYLDFYASISGIDMKISGIDMKEISDGYFLEFKKVVEYCGITVIKDQ